MDEAAIAIELLYALIARPKLPMHRRCVRGHVQCSVHHAELVQDYTDERRRQYELAMEISAGYDTEFADYVAEHPLVTFRDWLTKR